MLCLSKFKVGERFLFSSTPFFLLIFLLFHNRH